MASTRNPQIQANVERMGCDMCSVDNETMTMHEEESDKDNFEEHGGAEHRTQNWCSWNVGKKSTTVTVEELRTQHIDVASRSGLRRPPAPTPTNVWFSARPPSRRTRCGVRRGISVIAVGCMADASCASAPSTQLHIMPQGAEDQGPQLTLSWTVFTVLDGFVLASRSSTHDMMGAQCLRPPPGKLLFQNSPAWPVNQHLPQKLCA